MIVEERAYLVKPGHVKEWLDFYEAKGLPVQQRHLGKLIGFFTTELGTLNTVVHWWQYDDLAHRERARATMAKDPEWGVYVKESPKVLMQQDIRILVPVSFSPLK